ncbi:hypothetical protein EH244_29565 [Variovorax beijingensis]|uniref:Uncharacterized protein n=1 Tax=Variovorax beijingensis TaxID=2496117 RepID=A0A3P3E7M1_9BURK|nr:hypothetical protein [Variovorax beijingensis]RRH81058.1 hypothetical protein EH244_29565 [Variovorax beijingensis]
MTSTVRSSNLKTISNRLNLRNPGARLHADAAIILIFIIEFLASADALGGRGSIGLDVIGELTKQPIGKSKRDKDLPLCVEEEGE